MLTLLAEGAAGVSETDLTPVASFIGSLGFAIWFAYYTTTTTIPTQQRENREAIERLQKEHREAIEKLTTTHSETIKSLIDEMKQARESFDRWRCGGH